MKNRKMTYRLTPPYSPGYFNLSPVSNQAITMVKKSLPENTEKEVNYLPMSTKINLNTSVNFEKKLTFWNNSNKPICSNVDIRITS